MPKLTCHSPLLLLSCLLSGGLAFHAQAQQKGAASANAKFEIVSIKPCKSAPSGGGGDGFSESPGRLHFECVTVDTLVRNAYIILPRATPESHDAMPVVPYGLWHQQIKGSPAWIQSDRYTIDAKAPGPASPQTMRGPLMQTLLKDRFQLKIHMETREVPVYYLTVAKGGAKFPQTKEGSCVAMDPSKGPPPPRKPGSPAPTPFCNGLQLSGKGGLEGTVTMALLCDRFSRAMDRDVFDQTGLAGSFDVHLDLTFADLPLMRSSASTASQSANPQAPPLASDPGKPVPNALWKIGLQLQPGRKSEEFVVIDHVERPAGN